MCKPLPSPGPVYNQTQPKPKPSGLHLPLTMTWMAALTRIVPGLFESWARPADEDHTNKDRAEARKAAIDTLTDAALKLDGANAALAVAMEEIDRLAHGIAELEAGTDPVQMAEWEGNAEQYIETAAARIQAAAKGEQA